MEKKDYISSKRFIESLSRVKEKDYEEINKALDTGSKDMYQLADKMASAEEKAAATTN